MIKDDDKKKALDAALAQIEKQYGKGAVMKLGDKGSVLNVETIPTGSLSLDIALGVGGVPRGRIVEIYGPESSGKTTVALHIVAEVQKRGGIAGFIDAEHALDPVYAEALGVDIDNLLVAQPDTGEDALEIAEALIRSGAIDVLVVDSVAALVPKAEIEGEMGDSHVGLQARLMSQALRKLAGAINKSNCVAIFINQLREKVGVVYGNPEVTPGGRALKFYSSVRLEVRKAEAIKVNGEVIGNRNACKIFTICKHVRLKVYRRRVCGSSGSIHGNLRSNHTVNGNALQGAFRECIRAYRSYRFGDNEIFKTALTESILLNRCKRSREFDFFKSRASVEKHTVRW